MSNCPKCGKKLNPYYLKQNCPSCGENLMYYDFDNRLQADAALAQKEWDAVERLLNGIKTSSIGSVYSVIRLAVYLLSVVMLLLPAFEVNEERISLISFIQRIISDAGAVFAEKVSVLCLSAFVSVVAFALIGAVLSLLSYTKNGLKRNITVSVLGILVLIGLTAAVLAAGGDVMYGIFLVLAFDIIITVLHKAVDHKIK